LTPAQTRRSLRLFAEEVMPAFTGSIAPVASGSLHHSGESAR
jgi:hypothetical protein